MLLPVTAMVRCSGVFFAINVPFAIELTIIAIEATIVLRIKNHMEKFKMQKSVLRSIGFVGIIHAYICTTGWPKKQKSCYQNVVGAMVHPLNHK